MGGQLEDEKFLEILRASDGTVTAEGADMREKLESVLGQMNAAVEILDTLEALRESPGTRVTRLQDSIADFCEAGGTPSQLLLKKCVRFQSVDLFIEEGSLELALAYSDDGVERQAEVLAAIRNSMKVVTGDIVSMRSLRFPSLEEKTKFRREILYDMLSAPLWEKDDDAKAKKLVGDLCAVSYQFPGDEGTLQIIAQCLQELSLKTMNLRAWQDLRASTKANCRLMRQFCNLPYGSKLIAQIDQFILQSKKDMIQHGALAALVKSLGNAESLGIKRSTDVAKIGKHFTSLKTTLRGIIANASEAFLDYDPASFTKCADAFDEVVLRLATLYTTNFNLAAYLIIEKIQQVVNSGNADDSIVKDIQALGAIVPAADKAGIKDIGNEDHNRDWVAASLLQKRFISALTAFHSCSTSATEQKCADLREAASFLGSYPSDIEIAKVVGPMICDNIEPWLQHAWSLLPRFAHEFCCQSFSLSSLVHVRAVLSQSRIVWRGLRVPPRGQAGGR